VGKFPGSWKSYIPILLVFGAGGCPTMATGAVGPRRGYFVPRRGLDGWGGRAKTKLA